jgi:uncharacterized membrane protein
MSELKPEINWNDNQGKPQKGKTPISMIISKIIAFILQVFLLIILLALAVIVLLAVFALLKLTVHAAFGIWIL